MNIIIEGPDGSGKSTLAEFLSRSLHWPVLHSKGPLADQDEFEERARHYLSCHHTIFDRHTIISEDIYGKARGRTRVFDGHRLRLYSLTQDIRIYSALRPPGQGHVLKAHDTPEHIAMINSRHAFIHEMYEKWALNHAHIIYHGNQIQTLRLVKGAII